jgi:hypothetical protein
MRPVKPPAEAKPAARGAVNAADAAACANCHAMDKLLANSRPGYRHFELVHGVVTERKLPCIACHGEMAPFRADSHKIDRVAQVQTCAVCHMGSQ